MALWAIRHFQMIPASFFFLFFLLHFCHEIKGNEYFIHEKNVFSPQGVSHQLICKKNNIFQLLVVIESSITNHFAAKELRFMSIAKNAVLFAIFAFIFQSVTRGRICGMAIFFEVWHHDLKWIPIDSLWLKTNFFYLDSTHRTKWIIEEWFLTMHDRDWLLWQSTSCPKSQKNWLVFTWIRLNGNRRFVLLMIVVYACNIIFLLIFNINISAVQRITWFRIWQMIIHGQIQFSNVVLKDMFRFISIIIYVLEGQKGKPDWCENSNCPLRSSSPDQINILSLE